MLCVHWHPFFITLKLSIVTAFVHLWTITLKFSLYSIHILTHDITHFLWIIIALLKKINSNFTFPSAQKKLTLYWQFNPTSPKKNPTNKHKSCCVFTFIFIYFWLLMKFSIFYFYFSMVWWNNHEIFIILILSWKMCFILIKYQKII